MAGKRQEGALPGARLGREIVGVDLASALTDPTFAAVQACFADNPVLVFRDRSLEARDIARFARRFGEIRPGVIEKRHHTEAPEISFLTDVEADGSVDGFDIGQERARHHAPQRRRFPAGSAPYHAAGDGRCGSGLDLAG